MKLLCSGVAKENLKAGISLNIGETKRAKHIKSIFNKTASSMLDFLDLPDMSKDEIGRMQEVGSRVAKKFKNFVVLGIGGSALGIKFLQDTFVDSVGRDIGINVYVCDNSDSDSFVSLLGKLD